MEGLTVPQRKVLRFLEEREELGEAPPTYREICKHFGYSSTKAAADHIAALEKKGFVKREKRHARGLRLVQKMGIPLLGSIAAGLPHEALTQAGQRLVLDPAIYGIRNRAKAFALRVNGDSMIGRHVSDGDIVLMEEDVIPEDGNIVAALIDNECTLKTFVGKSGKAWLHAENPKYPDLEPRLNMRIQGVGRAVIRFLNK